LANFVILALMSDARADYIRLLRRSVDQFTPEPGQRRDATLIGELAEAGYVKAEVASDELGVAHVAVRV
jgi:hypothetical protein